jgi:hypothetical protein
MINIPIWPQVPVMAHRDMIELRWPSIAIGALRTWLDLQLAPGRDCHAATTGRHPQKELAPAQVSAIIMFSRLLVSHPDCRAVLIQIVAP